MMATQVMEPRVAELAAVFREPVAFATKVLGHDLWSKQAAILRSVAEHPLTAVKACHSSSKTFLASEAVLWWLARWPDAKVVTTAPTWLQVKDLLWSEIRSAARGAQARYAFPEPTDTALRISPTRFAEGLSTDKPERFQGFHGGHVLVVFDEAPGVRAQIWEAMEGIRAGGVVHVLAIGNPVTIGGPFYEAFRGVGGWQTHTISAFDTPNLAGLSVADLQGMSDADLDDNVRPYLVTRRWVKERYDLWGEPHPLYQSRVLGEFPSDQENSVIPLSHVEAAVRRWRDTQAESIDERVDVLGVDVGGGGIGGDLTVIALRQADRITELRRFQRGDTMATVGRIRGIQQARGGQAVVDVIGIGAGVVDRLRELDADVEPFNAAERTDMHDQSGEMAFINKRSAAWWALRERLDPASGQELALPPDDRLMGDLTAPTWSIKSSGKIAVEAKEEIRKRLGRSTDDGDAVVMAFWQGDRLPPIEKVFRF